MGDGHQLPGGDGDLLGVAATGQQRAHLVADGPAGDALAQLCDATGALHAEIGRGAARGRVVALALQHVGPVQAGRGHVEDDLARPGLGRGHVLNLEHFGATWVGNHDGAHRITLASRDSAAAGRRAGA